MLAAADVGHPLADRTKELCDSTSASRTAVCAGSVTWTADPDISFIAFAEVFAESNSREYMRCKVASCDNLTI